ncbi:MAG: LPS-assembly protein LptD [Methyloceanibacter sp.]|uniref:LPS-assembly protein LptD n=1 Tax=Methyloceanibacter sp. TaxID=1965321 RepID=UPI003D6CFE88
MTRALANMWRMRRALPGLTASNGPPVSVARGTRSLWIFALLAVLLAPAQEAFAQAQTQLEQIVEPPKIPTGEPMLLQADEMIYDNENARITAKGNVEIYYGDYTLLADKVVYNRNANTLAAEGNVRMKDPDGAVITADQLTLTDDFRDGFVDALKLVTKDDTRIVAQSASREAGNVTVFQKGWFTPCKICEDKPSKPPTWRIRAGKITHKRDQAIITFNNAAFDFFGVPIVWVPYFQIADPTVERKSGFLMPSYSHSNELGSTVQVPYYFALSPHYDFTFAPMWTEKEGTLLLGNWRQRTATGGYEVELAGVWNDSDTFLSPLGTEESVTDGDFRGSIKTKGKFALDPYYAWGWDILLESDDTFRRFYNLDSRLKTDRISQIYLEGLHDRNYLSTRFYNTQSLLFEDEEFSEATVYPIIDYDYIVGKPILGGELSFNSNAMVFSSEDGTDSNRLILEANWRRQMIDGIGQVYTPFARLRGDAYDVTEPSELELSGSEDILTPDPEDGGILRGNAVAGIEYRYPFITTTGTIAHTVEPIGQIIARPNSVGDQQEIPNEDALSLVFDDTLLFDIDKFSGYDRIETGTRANVGFRYTAQFISGTYLRTVVGQSYQLAGENEFDTAFYQTSGLATDTSDYVTGVYLQATQNLSFSAQQRFDEDNLDVERTDLGTWVKFGPLQARANYAQVPNVIPAGISANAIERHPSLFTDAREEILAAGALAITDTWALLGNLRYDLSGDQTITDGLGLRYQDDCFRLDVTYQRSFIRDQDIEPDERFLVNFALKYLGTYNFATEFSDFGAEGSDTND